MATGRRSFLKQLGGILAGLTVAGKLKAQEAEKLRRYPETFQKNSIKKVAEIPTGQMYPLSGVYYVTGMMCGPTICCSGQILPEEVARIKKRSKEIEEQYSAESENKRDYHQD
jgi:hypothetical protein